MAVEDGVNVEKRPDEDTTNYTDYDVISNSGFDA